MAINDDGIKRSYFSWGAVARVGITLAFFFWFYIIWNSTADLNAKLRIATDQYSALHNIQVEYKNEVQEWKNVLLRSNSRDTLDKNWRIYETQYQKVAAAAQDIMLKNDIRAVNNNIKTFIEAHAANHGQYKNSVEVLVKNGFDPHPADAAVKGIDRPLLDYLEAADSAMQDEKESINEGLTAKARSQIEQSLLALGFLALLVIWMPKW